MCIKHGKKVSMRELIQPIKTQFFFFISYEVDQIYMTNCTRLSPYSFTLLTGLLYAICLSLKTLFHVMILVWIYIFRNLADIKEERDRRSDAIFLNNNKNEVKNCPYEWPNPEIIMNSDFIITEIWKNI